MKTFKNLFNHIIDENHLYESYKHVYKETNTKDKYIFNIKKFDNLDILKQELIDETYEVSSYNHFFVYEPKKREIYAPKFIDKIVQMALFSVLIEKYQPTFIDQSYASLKGKGVHKCSEKLQKYIQSADDVYQKPYVIKLDISKFFYSINRNIMKNIYSRKIKDEKTLRLLFKIIDSMNTISPKGLPLGNVISQLSANVYMNELDQYIKRELKVKYYLRYMDDMVLIVDSLDKARQIFDKCKEFCKDTLDLELNPKKSKIFPLKQGINMVGFKTNKHKRAIRNQTKRKIKRYLRMIEKHPERKDLIDIQNTMGSYLSIIKFSQNKKFARYLNKRFEFIHYDSRKEKLAITPPGV